jgi:beta-1,4-mannosyltransferase
MASRRELESNGGEDETKVVYLSPFTNSTNSYIELQKDLLTELGYRAEPLSFKHWATRLLGRNTGGAEPSKVPGRDSIVALHWLETRLFRRNGAGVTWSWRGAAEVLAYLAVIRGLRCRTVYFVHNHTIHDGTERQRAAARHVVRWLCRVADERVVHDPSFESTYEATYLPHPVYWDANRLDRASSGEQQRIETIRSDDEAVQRPPQSLRFGILGALRPYKRLHEVLAAWPAEFSLELRGKGDAEYVSKLERTIEERRLTNVSLVNQFVPDGQVGETLRSWDVAILPQMTDSMLVSGAFFEVIGVVRGVIMRDTPFARWCAGVFGGVWVFSEAEELPEVLGQVSEALGRLPSSEQTRDEALRRFGWQTCLSEYGNFWKRLSGVGRAHSVTESSEGGAGVAQAAAQ